MAARQSRAKASVDTIQVVEHEGRLWKPEPGATATFDEYLEAHVQLDHIVEDRRWNPWDRPSFEDETSDRVAIVEQWVRAEPGFRYWTRDELDEYMAASRDRREAEREQYERDRQARIPLYDATREAARLSLLENQSILQHRQTELTGHLDRTSYSKMAADRREREIAELQEKIAPYQARVSALEKEVGDVETVVDSHGLLPRDRRMMALVTFETWRYSEIERLRESTQTAKNAGGRRTQSKVDSFDAAKLAALMKVPRPTAEQMCPDCHRPQAWDCWSMQGIMALYTGPCPAWPGWSARRKAALALFDVDSAARAKKAKAATKQPLAVIPSGLPISELMVCLAEVQAQHPDARAVRGRANRWEIWPSE